MIYLPASARNFKTSPMDVLNEFEIIVNYYYICFMSINLLFTTLSLENYVTCSFSASYLVYTLI